MMILASEAEILALLGPIVYEEDPNAEIDPAIAALSPEEAAAFAEGQVKNHLFHFVLMAPKMDVWGPK